MNPPTDPRPAVAPPAAASPGARPVPPETPGNRRALAVMTVSHAIQHFYVGGLAVTYPFVVAALHVSYARLGVILTVAGVAGGLLQAAAGTLHRVSARLTLTAQNAGMALAALLGGWAPGFGLFAGARVFGSLVSWPQHPIGSAYLAERFQHRRATALSWHTAGGSLGTVASPLVASSVLAIAGWRWALTALAGTLLIGAVAVNFGLPPQQVSTVARPPGDKLAKALPAMLRDRRVLAVLAAGTIAAGGRGLGTLTTYIPAYLRTGLRLPALTVGAVFAVVMGASVLGPVVGGYLGDRLGRRRTLVATYLSGAAALAAFGYTGRHLAVLITLGLLVGVLAYAESPLLQALFADLTTQGTAPAAFGVFFAISFGVGSLWTALVGWVITTAGFGVAFAMMAASFAVSAVFIALLPADPPRSDRGRSTTWNTA